MKIVNTNDTIAAIGTPVGIGGIAVIRISGPKVLDILYKIFRKKGRSYIPWRVYYGKIFDQRQEMDEVLVTYFRRPNSYTKEEMVEISCHGGVYVSKRILELVLKHGARLAEPGEFTKRAFLNGRIDLTQAEAIADLIKAKTEIGLQSSIRQLKGFLSGKIIQISEGLLNLCSLLEIELDFSDEDIQFVDRREIKLKINLLIEELTALSSTFQKGKIIKDGIELVIVGKPNVGKSSLLNALLREDRAIVTEFAGTTRDSIEESVVIKGILFKIIDTAGIIKTNDIIEQKGIIRTEQYLETSDIILHVLDSSDDFNTDDLKISEKLIKKREIKNFILIVVANKIDLNIKIDLTHTPYDNVEIPIIKVSAVKMLGIQELEDELYRLVCIASRLHDDKYSEIIISNIRHVEAIKKAMEDLKEALNAINKNESSEFIAFEIKNAINNLGVIIGTITNEDILTNIFDSFCIGK